MRRSALALTVAAAAVAFFVAVPLGAAAPGNGNGAIVGKTGRCAYFNDAVGLAVQLRGKLTFVETPSGNMILVCHFDAGDILVGAPTRFEDSGWPCTVNGVLTYDSLFTMNSEGNALLRCIVHG